MSDQMPRRFIAGAVCPRCAAMDRIVMYDDGAGGRVRECVACGYQDSVGADGRVRELPTRVNKVRPGERPLAHEDEVRVIDVIDPRRDH